MTRFVKVGGDVVSTSQIVQVRKTKRGATVWLVDGSTLEAFDYEAGPLIDELMETGATIVPAAPGYVVLHPYLDELDELEIWTEQVVAFKHVPWRFGMWPLTVRNEVIDGEDTFVLAPDGTVHEVGCLSWANLDDFKREALRRLTAERRRTG